MTGVISGYWWVACRLLRAHQEGEHKVGTLGRRADAMEIEHRKRDVGTCDKGRDVTILLSSRYATGNDSRLLRKRVSLFCTRA